MYMTFKTNFYFMKQENKLLNNLHIFIQFEIKINFQNEMQNLVEFVYLKKKS
jgi:hypothetical protein